MKKLSIILILSLSLTLFGCSKKENSNSKSNINNSKNEVTEEKTPDTGLATGKLQFNSLDIDGNSVSSSELFAKKKYTMVNVWGTFCGPCISEMPELAKISEEFKDKDFQIVGIIADTIDSRDDNKDTAKTLISDANVNYLNIVPNEEMLNNFLYEVSALPTTFFVDSKGQIINEPILGARSGADWTNIINSIIE